MACHKYRIPCDECEFANFQDRCPGANFWNRLCGLTEIKEEDILSAVPKKTFGKLFRSLQLFLPEINFNTLSSNKVSSLKRNEVITLLKAIRHKNKELVQPDFVNLNNEEISKLLYRIMIIIHESRDQLQT